MKLAFSKGFLLKNHLLRANYKGFVWSGWIVLIKSESLITTGVAWPVSSGKWKAPEDTGPSKPHPQELCGGGGGGEGILPALSPYVGTGYLVCIRKFIFYMKTKGDFVSIFVTEGKYVRNNSF